MASGRFSFGKGGGRRLAILVGLAAACSAAAATAAAGAAGSAGLAQVSAAPRAPANARRVGTVGASSVFAGAVVLRPRDNGALQRFIGEVSDPGSPLFHHYLAPGAFAGRFGPTAATIDAVKKQLSGDDLSVTDVTQDGLLVRFRGTAARIERAFHAGLERYRLTNGATGHIMTSAPMLPTTIARSVAAVVGLDTLIRLQPLGVVRPPRSTWGTRRKAVAASFPHPRGAPKACHAASAAAQSFGGLTDDEIAHAYGAFGLYGAGDVGAGQHIALYELEPFRRSDIKVFDTCYFGASEAAKKLARLHVIAVDGGQPAGTGSGEALLDVEDLEAMAPGASVDVYEGPSPSADGVEYDPIDEYVAIIDNDRDRVISTSWGLCEQAIQDGQPGLQAAENLLFEQAAAQGQTIFAAAGDNGSDDCGPETTTLAAGQNPVSVDDPGSQPYVISVGGTSIDDASSQPPVEQVWNDGGSGGAGGGGISQSWTMPAWQRQATVPGIPKPGSSDYKNAAGVERKYHFPRSFCQSKVSGATSSTPCRVVPDVSSQADEFTGAVTVYQAAFGGWGPTGGTSSATPIWAGMLADVNASPACASSTATRGGVGFADPLLYAVASVPGEYAASFNDVTKGNNDVYGLDNGLVFPATSGFDLASGLGSPRLSGPGDTAGLAYYLCRLGASASESRPVVTKLTPSSGSAAGEEKITISGRGFESGGKQKVAWVEVGAAQLGPTSFKVDSANVISATLPPAKATRPPDAPAPQNGAGPAQLIVVRRDGATSAPSPRSRFEYVDTRHTKRVPGITGVIPIGGTESAPGKVTILGSGFTGAGRVTFGGVPAARYKVDGPNRITATPQPYSGATACSPLPKTGVYAGEDATNDICQVQVRVGNHAGVSAIGRIRPPLEGAITLNSLGDLVAPPGCGCEIAPAPTEYDYLPTPKVSSVSTSSGGPAGLASESKSTVVTLHGAGLGPLTVEWADFGNPALESSMDTNFVYETGTEMQIAAPRRRLTVGRVSVRFSVKTLAGQSASLPVTYAGVPKVSRVINKANSKQLHGIYGVPDTGRTPIQIDGKGFAGQLVTPIKFVAKGGIVSTQYKFGVDGNDRVSTQSVGEVPALDEVELCTVSGCSHNRRNDELYAYAPGNPRVTSVSPRSGPARGGTKVTIGGVNLGCATGVFFGHGAAKSFARVPAALYCGATTAVDAKSPRGTAGRSVPVSVETVESYFTGAGRGTTSARFKYK